MATGGPAALLAHFRWPEVAHWWPIATGGRQVALWYGGPMPVGGPIVLWPTGWPTGGRMLMVYKQLSTPGQSLSDSAVSQRGEESDVRVTSRAMTLLDSTRPLAGQLLLD